MDTKNIVLCSDGTGNTDTEGRGTNVFKLYEAVDIHGYKSAQGFPRQIAFYGDGVGTENFALHKIIGAAFGFGFAQNIRDLYTELVHVYDPGDKLFLFGFSRGAYTIRALSGLIQYCGVLDRAGFPNEEQLRARVHLCWKSFEKIAFPRFISSKEDQRRRTTQPAEDPEVEADRRKKLGSHPPAIEIEFIGVWDTVGAVGMPVDELKPLVNWIWPRKFDELTPGARVKRARHALAIDDERRTFHPELWNERGARGGQIDQVWFAGVHSNVGGGYPKHGMSLVTLDWMMSEAEKSGLRFIQAARDYVRAQQDVHSKLYDSRSGLAVYYRWDPRNIAQICRDHGIEKPKIHASVLERIAFRTDGYAPGNIPANLEVVNLQGPPGRTQQINALVQNEIKALPVSSLLDLADVKRWMRVGKITYFGFLALSLFAIGWGLYTAVPAPVATSLWGRVTDVIVSLWNIVTSFEALWKIAVTVVSTWWWFAPGLIICYLLAISVDYKLERRFSGFWHKLRQPLRAFF